MLWTPRVFPRSVQFHKMPPLVNKSFIKLCTVTRWERTPGTFWPAAHFSSMCSRLKNPAMHRVTTETMLIARVPFIRLHCFPLRETWRNTSLTCSLISAVPRHKQCCRKKMELKWMCLMWKKKKSAFHCGEEKKRVGPVRSSNRHVFHLKIIPAVW